MKFALDSNILVYALISDDSAKHETAARLLLQAPQLDSVLPTQVLAEFLNVIRRKHPEHFEKAIAQAVRWQATLPLLSTTDEHVVNGARLASAHQLQLWDAIIWQVARSAHAVLFISEDLQDGLTLNGMRVLDPFNSANERELHHLIAGGPEQ